VARSAPAAVGPARGYSPVAAGPGRRRVRRPCGSAKTVPRSTIGC